MAKKKKAKAKGAKKGGKTMRGGKALRGKGKKVGAGRKQTKKAGRARAQKIQESFSEPEIDE